MEPDSSRGRVPCVFSGDFFKVTIPVMQPAAGERQRPGGSSTQRSSMDKPSRTRAPRVSYVTRRRCVLEALRSTLASPRRPCRCARYIEHRRPVSAYSARLRLSGWLGAVRFTGARRHHLHPASCSIRRTHSQRHLSPGENLTSSSAAYARCMGQSARDVRRHHTSSWLCHRQQSGFLRLPCRVGAQVWRHLLKYGRFFCLSGVVG